MSAELLTWAEQYRMNWIRESVRIFGFLNCEHIQKKFSISKPQASNDIKMFMSFYPEIMKYNLSTKRYELLQQP